MAMDMEIIDTNPPPDGEIAIEAAQLRLAVAEKWAKASAALLQNAQSQAQSSQKELHDAREYLQRLERKRKNSCVIEKEEGSVVALNSLSGGGGTSNETTSPSVGSNSGRNAPDTEATESASEDYIGDVHVTDYEAENGKKGRHRKSKLHRGHANATPLDTTNTKNSNIRDFRKTISDTAEKVVIKNKSNVISPTASASSNPTEEVSVAADTDDHPAKKSDRIMCCNAITVTDCGIPEVNGKYVSFDSSDGVPAYSKIDSYNGKEVIFTIGRWKSDAGPKKWYITATAPGGRRKGSSSSSSEPNKFVFYVAYATSFAVHPPKKNWMVVEGRNDDDHTLPPEYEARGVPAAPLMTPEFGIDIKIGGSRPPGRDSKAPRNGRRKSRSVSTSKIMRNVRSVSTDRFQSRGRG
mmetsp:Transcript_7665/g.16685  ORF Transcript_7665/g.16685 Transcript_7665/m.16685 type:complete len:409 (+) Transcript_7665:59-1285(+)